MTFQQQLDVRTYPYEYRNLEIKYTSFYSSNIVNMSTFPVQAGTSDPTVPAGWTPRDACCSITAGQRGRVFTEISEGEIYVPTVNSVV
jgi:hypothetical protein